MRVRKKTLWGKIDSKGELGMRWAELEEFCKLHPNCNIILRAEIQSKEPSKKMKAYFFGYVLQEMQRAMYENGEDLTEQGVYDKIRRECPVFCEEIREEGKWKVRVREWEELDTAEAVEAIAWVQRYGAENYYTIINDAINN